MNHTATINSFIKSHYLALVMANDDSKTNIMFSLEVGNHWSAPWFGLGKRGLICRCALVKAFSSLPLYVSTGSVGDYDGRIVP